MRKIIHLCLLISFCAISQSAEATSPLPVVNVEVYLYTADIDGKWTAKVPGPEGDMTLEFTFKVEGDQITGHSKGPFGDYPITNGQIDGNDFSFDVDVDGILVKHQCHFDDGLISVTAMVMEEKVEYVLKTVTE